MRRFQWPSVVLTVAVLTVAVLLTPQVPARADPPGGEWRDVDRPEGQGFCFGSQLVFGRFVIQGGRCYSFYLVRTGANAFLGFGPPGATLMPPGQFLRMGSAEQLRSLFYYLVPLAGVAAAVPVNGAQLINVQVTIPQPNRLVILLPRGALGGAQPVEVGFSR